MRPTPAELEVARALIARVKAADPSIKRVDELLVCAAVACRADELGGVPNFALGRWATERGLGTGGPSGSRHRGQRSARDGGESMERAPLERVSVHKVLETLSSPCNSQFWS